MSYTKCAIIAIIFLSWYPLYPQNDFDSKYPTPLTEKSYEELDSLFFITEHTPQIAVEYAMAYLQKAKKARDSFEIPKGYKYFVYLYQDTTGLKYCDSIIYSSKNLNSKYFPAFGYMLKGYLLYELGDDKKALKSYIEANKYAVNKNNSSQIIEIKQAIAVLKDKWGEHKEALNLNLEIYNFIRNQPDYNSTYKFDYLIALYNLSLSYINNKMLDSAYFSINEGIIEIKKSNDTTLINNFIFLKGVVQFKNKQFKESLISMKNAMPNINDKNLILSNLYIGKIHNAYKDIDHAIFYFKIVDSLVQINNHYDPEVTEAYQVLIDYYKSKNDLENQLKYIERLLYVDSIIKNNYIQVNSTITKQYDVPILIAKREKIIKEFQHNQKYNFATIYILVSLSLVLIIFVLIYYYRQKKYKKRLKNLLNVDKQELSKQKIEEKRSKIDIDEDIINDILNKLKKFETETAYLQRGLNLAEFSKELNTNSTYLSKIINIYKGQNFSNYLNELRINHAISRLKQDEKFRLYSIKAIAEETGYSNSQSFSTAFYKKTGIQPSYFVSELKKIKMS